MSHAGGWWKRYQRRIDPARARPVFIDETWAKRRLGRGGGRNSHANTGITVSASRTQ